MEKHKLENLYNGKAIYNPKNKAQEYSQWACNFFKGCSNMCTYCYCKKGIMASVMGGDKPELKKCLVDIPTAKKIFTKEMVDNKAELQKHGLFFSFTTDPMLPETRGLTFWAMEMCMLNRIPVKILTKRTDWIIDFNFSIYDGIENEVAFGSTLTGHDELEPYASINSERVKTMGFLKKRGFKTFASIEPTIDFKSSYQMIIDSFASCDLFKIGLESGKSYDKADAVKFFNDVNNLVANSNINKIYWKDSLLKLISVERKDLPTNCVGRDYNIFKNE